MVSGMNDPVFGRGSRAKMAADVVAAGDLDQLGNPSDPGDQRLVPLLQEDARAGATMLLLARDRLKAPANVSAASRRSINAPRVRTIARMPAMSRWLNR
jgi:hypothetical protein